MKYYVEIAYCIKGRGVVLGCKTEAKTILFLCQEMGIDCTGLKVGIDGEAVFWDHKIDRPCRIELYPSLKISPIERRKRLVLAKKT